MLIALVTLALAFHLIPTPPDLGSAGEFQLGGYTVPADCTEDDDEHGICVRTAVAAPQFIPETLKVRPIAHVTFVAPFDGRCGIAQAETLHGETQFVLAAVVTVHARERAFLRGVLLDQDEGTAVGWNVREHYRIVVMCASDDHVSKEPSAFYEITPPTYPPL